MNCPVKEFKWNFNDELLMDAYRHLKSFSKIESGLLRESVGGPQMVCTWHHIPILLIVNENPDNVYAQNVKDEAMKFCDYFGIRQRKIRFFLYSGEEDLIWHIDENDKYVTTMNHICSVKPSNTPVEFKCGIYYYDTAIIDVM